MTILRRVTKVLSALPTSDGAGVNLYRTIGTKALDNLDPFLLLDELKSDKAGDYLQGFPDHPHRGFETVTYMLHGKMEHKDHAGNSGLLSDGSVQWMTAGRGIVHSEMPKQTDGLLWGFQLWINLPSHLKMCPPRYQDIPSTSIPTVTTEKAAVKVIAGKYLDTEGPVQGISSNPSYFDVRLQPGGSFLYPFLVEHSVFLYVYQGTLCINDPALAIKEVPSRHLVIFESPKEIADRKEEKEYLNVSVFAHQNEEQEVGFILLSAHPVNEPIARRGPFVMNTQAEIKQAFEDYSSGRF